MEEIITALLTILFTFVSGKYGKKLYDERATEKKLLSIVSESKFEKEEGDFNSKLLTAELLLKIQEEILNQTVALKEANLEIKSSLTLEMYRLYNDICSLTEKNGERLEEILKLLSEKDKK